MLFWSILQYFWPALSYNRSWKTIFGLFSGRLRQVLLYILIYRLRARGGGGQVTWKKLRKTAVSGSQRQLTLKKGAPGDQVWDLLWVQLASYLERDQLVWRMSLHVNQKSDYDYDDLSEQFLQEKKRQNFNFFPTIGQKLITFANTEWQNVRPALDQNNFTCILMVFKKGFFNGKVNLQARKKSEVKKKTACKITKHAKNKYI